MAGIRYKSFHERGVYVGFLGRTVEMVRCRRARDQELFDFEAIIPNFGGDDTRSSNDLVMPFRDVPEWSDLLGRDALLHERIASSYDNNDGYLDPITVRELRLDCDIEAGEERDQRIAENEKAISRIDIQNAFLEILAMFGRKYAEIQGETELRSVSRHVLMSLGEANPKDMMRLVRIIVGSVVEGADVGREELQVRLDTLSDYAAPICSLVTDDSSRQVGYLSRQMQLLEQLHQGITEYCANGNCPVEVVDGGAFIENNLGAFMDYTLNRAHVIKAAVMDDSYYLSDSKYQGLLDLIREERVKISFALDGWAGHATRWLSVDADDLGARNAVLTFILKQMPAPPRELDEFVEKRFGYENVMAMRGRVVKEMHSWMDDSLDKEIYNRVMRARSASNPINKAKAASETRSDVAKAVKQAIGY